MKKICIVLLTALFGYAAPPPASNPGVVYEIETTDHSASPPRVEQTEISAEGRNLKMGIAPEHRRGAKGEMIFRGDRGEIGEMVFVDHDEKGYYVMDEAAMKDLAGAADNAMKEVEAALKNVPEDQRAIMEKMLKERMGGAAKQTKARSQSEIRNTGQKDRKNGYPCVKYEVFKDGKKVREIWITDWDNIAGGDEAAKAFRGLYTFLEAMWEAMPMMSGEKDPFAGFDDMNFKDGFPIITRDLDEDGSVERESTLKSARRQSLDPAAFEPPAGYKRMSMGPR